MGTLVKFCEVKKKEDVLNTQGPFGGRKKRDPAVVIALFHFNIFERRGVF